MIKMERSLFIEILEGVLRAARNTPENYVIEAPSFEDACLKILYQHAKSHVAEWLKHELIKLIVPEVDNGYS